MCKRINVVSSSIACILFPLSSFHLYLSPRPLELPLISHGHVQVFTNRDFGYHSESVVNFVHIFEYNLEVFRLI